MKHLVFLLALAVAVPSAGSAQETNSPDQAQPGIAGGHGKAAFLATYDSNGDGEVPLAEYKAIREARFFGADTDGDGALNEDEYVAEFKTRLDQQYTDQGREIGDERYQGNIKQAHNRFAIVDRSRDMILTWEEQEEVAKSTFENNDTDGNGVVNAADPVRERRNNDSDTES